MNPLRSPQKIPALYWPHPVKMHPQIDELEKNSIEFLDRFRLYDDEKQRNRLILARCAGGLTGMLFPTGPMELQQAASDYSMWVFAFDDYYCDEGPTRNDPAGLASATARFHRAIEAPELVIDPEDNYALALRDVRLRLDKYAPAELVAQWTDAIKGWFLIEIFKASNVLNKVKPGLSDGANLRLQCGGGYGYIALIPIVRQINISIKALCDRRIRALWEMSNMIVNWGSEAYAYHKEAHRAHDEHNMIDVIKNEYKCTSEQALAHLNSMYERITSRFLQLHSEVFKDLRDTTEKEYLEALIDYASGGLRWSQISKRNVFLDTVDDGTKAFIDSGLTGVAHEDLSCEPVPIPALAWWWAVGARNNCDRTALPAGFPAAQAT